MANPATDDIWDVVVVGAGPAGSSAARVAAERGARVLLLDRARFPRDKTCGGGLVGTALRWLPPGVRAGVPSEVRRVRVTRGGRAPIEVRASIPLLGMVDRRTFDAALVDAAVASGAEFRDGCAVRGVEEDAAGVTVRTDAGEVHARVVVGADGTGSRIAQHVGVTCDRVDLGLEDELRAAVPLDEVMLDWGPVPGSYAWLFPHRDEYGTVAVVGVIARRGNPDATRAYLADWRGRLGLADAPVVRSSGHLTRVRDPRSPLVRGRVLVAGDAAGLLEPWTREGISSALRSGSWAGAAAARAASGDPDALDRYAARIARELEPERVAGLGTLRIFERGPRLAHLTLRSRAGRRFFVRFCLGRTSLARLLRIPLAGRLLRTLS